MNDTPFISVVMPTYNRSGFLTGALDALLNQSYPRDRYEIIVVDDASTDQTQKVLEGLHQSHRGRLHTFRQMNNAGPAAARNRGISEANGTLIAFTDDDCRSASNWLEELHQGYQEPGIAGIGGTVRSVTEDTAPQRYQGRYGVLARPSARRGQVTSLVTANAVFRLDALQRVAGFDEGYGCAAGEDTDLCLRLRKLGYRLRHNSNAVVYHRYPASWRSFFSTYYRYGLANAYYDMRQHSYPHPGHIMGFLTSMFLPHWLWRYAKHGVPGRDVVAFSLLEMLRGLSFLLGLGRGYLAYRERARQ